MPRQEIEFYCAPDRKVGSMPIRRRRPKHVKVSVVVSSDEYALLERTAMKRCAPVSIVVRELILRWLAEDSSRECDQQTNPRAEGPTCEHARIDRRSAGLRSSAGARGRYARQDGASTDRRKRVRRNDGH